MTLQKIDVFSVRNIQNLSFHPSPAINFIFGANASGKSALLEAIFILGRAKSFRAASIKSVIQFQQNHLIISALTTQANGTSCHLGVQLDGKNMDIRINKQSSHNRADLALALPLQLLHPKSFELLDAGPQLRREFIDWGCFNDFDNFLTSWRKFKKALSQRNALLKSKSIVQINVWDKELVYYGTIVNDFRCQYLQQLKPVFLEILTHFIDVDNIDLLFLKGWDSSKSFQQTLADDLEKDVRYGFTHSGPHRADFQLLVNYRLAKDYVSRGQLKLLVLSLKLAQVQLLANQQKILSCVMIDDFAAELDMYNRAKLLNYLSTINCQVFITANEIADFGDLTKLHESKMFHMEHGNLKPI